MFRFILFEKRRLAQGIRRPKAANSPLYTMMWRNASMKHLLLFSLKNVRVGNLKLDLNLDQICYIEVNLCCIHNEINTIFVKN